MSRNRPRRRRCRRAASIRCGSRRRGRVRGGAPRADPRRTRRGEPAITSNPLFVHRDVTDITAELTCSVSSRCYLRVCSSGSSPRAGCASSTPAAPPMISPERPGRVPRSASTTRRCTASWSSGRGSICRRPYVDGTLTIEEGSLYDLIDLLQLNIEAMPEGVLSRLLNGSYKFLRRVHQYNPLTRARQQRRPPLRSVGSALRAVSRSRPAIFLRLFPRRERQISNRRSSTKNGTSRPS